MAAAPSCASPAWTGNTTSAGVPTRSGGTNGAGGRRMADAIIVSSSGAVAANSA